MSYDALLEWCRMQAGQFAPFICDAGAFLQQAHDSGKRIVLEAQLGAMRDIDYGIFPFTSSSNTLAAYAPLGAGIPNCRLDHVVGVLKAIPPVWVQAPLRQKMPWAKLGTSSCARPAASTALHRTSPPGRSL